MRLPRTPHAARETPSRPGPDLGRLTRPGGIARVSVNLRRYGPVVVQNAPGGQVNIGEKQVNVGSLTTGLTADTVDE